MESSDLELSFTVFIQTFLPRDRCISLASGTPLPERATGTCLFADISGFTPLTESLAASLGSQQGAEVLTAILNDIFDALISQVHRYGGNMVGFGGDAITCWFSEPQTSPASALGCAQAMQRAIARFSSVPTPGGQTHTLSMKIGMAHGPMRRFLAGAPEYGYLEVLTGATLDRMAAAEHHADKGEIVCAPEIPSLVGDAATWGGSREGFHPLLSLQEIGFLQETRFLKTTADLPLEVLQPYLPPAILKSLRGARGGFLAELRPVVSAFVRFAGLDYDSDPQVGDKLNQYVTTAQQITTHYGGSVIRLDCGDKGSVLHVLFGAPIAHEDDEVRAVGWALELQAAVRDLPFITRQSIGITKGPVYAGAVGATTRRVYTVMGDEVNVSARLMQACQPGQILVSRRIMRATQKQFTFHQFPGFQVKGKYEPIPVAMPVAPLPPMPRMAPPEPLVGREAELTQLDDALNVVLAGAGCVLRIEGGAGVGKSRLVAELNQRGMARGLRTTMGSCQSVGQGTPYLPWREVFQALFGLQSGGMPAQQVAQINMMLQWINPDWLARLPLLGDLLGLDIPDTPTTAAFDARLRQQSLFALVSDLLTRWSAQQPLLLIIEDVHWIDEASAALIEALGLSLAAARVLLVVTQRPYEGNHVGIAPEGNHVGIAPEGNHVGIAPEGNHIGIAPEGNHVGIAPTLNALAHYRYLNLMELTPDAVRDLVTRRLGGELPPDTLAFIQERAQGNPFFAEELADALRDTSHLEFVEGRWVLASGVSDVPKLPDTIQGVVLARIDRADERSKLTLKVSSVIGRTFEEELVAQVHPAQPAGEILDSQLHTLENRDFIRLELPEPRLTYLFKHNITQEVVYGMLLFAQRRDLHRAVGEALEVLAPEAVERLAYHYSRSDARAKAATYLGAAADKARREYANETALDYYDRALALEQRAEWLRGKVEVLHMQVPVTSESDGHLLGQRAAERAALEALEAATEAPVFDVAYLWGRYYEAVAEYAEAQAAVERALGDSQEQGDIVGEARCLAYLGLIARRQGDYDKAKVWYNQAWGLLGGRDTYLDEEVQALTQVLNGLGIVHRQQGNFDEARSCYELALTLSRMSGNRVGEAEALNSLGVTAFYQRHFAEALTYHQQALEIRRAIGDRAGEGVSLGNLAQTVRDIGDYGQSRSYLSETLAIYQVIGDRWGEVNAWNDLGILYQELGDLSNAQSYLQRGLGLAQEIGDDVGQSYIQCNLGLVLRDQGDLVRAERLLSDGLALFQKDKHVVSFFLSYLSTVSLQAGRVAEAIERAQTALDIHRELDMRLNTADDLAVLGMAHLIAGDVDQAVSYTQQALAILEECGGEGPEFPQRDYFMCYQVLSAVGQEETARAALQSAYDLVTARAEKITDPALRESFLENVAQNREIVAEYVRREA